MFHKECSTPDLVEMVTRWSISLSFCSLSIPQSPSHSQNYHALCMVPANPKWGNLRKIMSILFSVPPNPQRRKNAFSAPGRIHCDRKTVLFSRFYTLGPKDRQFCRKGERRNKSSEFDFNTCSMLLYIHASCQSWSGTFARMTGEAPISLF